MKVVIVADILYWLALIFGLIMSISYFPQGWKQLKNKSSHNIAIITFAILLIGKIIWTFYGFQINDFPVEINYNPLAEINKNIYYNKYPDLTKALDFKEKWGYIQLEIK